MKEGMLHLAGNISCTRKDNTQNDVYFAKNKMRSPALSVGGLYRDCGGQFQERIAEEDPGKVRAPRAPLGTNTPSMPRNCGVAGTRFAGSTEYQ
jgi:hypothetical protein